LSIFLSDFTEHISSSGEVRIILTNSFREYPPSLQGNTVILPYIRLRPFCATSSPIQHFISIPWFVALFSATIDTAFEQIINIVTCTLIATQLLRKHVPAVWVWFLCYDRQSVGQSVLEQSTHLGPTTRYLLVFYNYGSVFVERPLWREDGSVMC
jgi:hypothetical protein